MYMYGIDKEELCCENWIDQFIENFNSFLNYCLFDICQRAIILCSIKKLPLGKSDMYIVRCCMTMHE